MVTHAVYAYRPLSLRSLRYLIEYQVLGQTARYERYTANMAYVMACGERLDKDRTEPFGNQVDEVYRNPFNRQNQRLETAQDIKDYVVKIFSE